MKLFKLLPLGAIACLAVSCQNGAGGSLSESASQTDSLMYYLGQMNAADYMREANRDTTLKETSAKQAYINGVRAGLAALKEGDDNYNKGVMLGMQMAAQMMSFSEQMEVNINRRSYVGSLQSALMADSMPNTNIAQTEFRKVMGNIERAKEEKDKKTSQESLKQAASQAGLPAINDDLYGKVTNSTDGAQLKSGDEVEVQAKITKEDGESINIPVAPKGKIGERRSYYGIISQALESLKSGETGDFLTTAHLLLGSRAKQMGLEPTDLVKINITASLVPQEEPAADESK